MIIKKRLIQITAIAIMFSVLLIGGLFQVAKGATFHKLNFLHVKYNAELRQLLPNSAAEPIHNIPEIMAVLFNIQAQPAACLKLINAFDRIIMALINTDRAIDLCNEDLLLANNTIESLEQFRRQEISNSDIYKILSSAKLKFASNSAEFESPISRTVDFIVVSTLIVFSVLSVMMLLSTGYVVRSISQSVNDMQKTSSALQDSERKNRQLAHFDSLTDLPNRNLFLDRLEQQCLMAKRRQSCFALLFIDLDHFKNVNDSMGHYAGDELICAAGKRIIHCIQESDTIARIGGDEFTVILHAVTSNADSESATKRILQSLAKPFDILGRQVFISASIGIATYPNDTDDITNLKKYADLAMYHAKNNGRNRFEFYSQELAQDVNKKINIEQQLRHALERNEFTLHYQPVINLQNMKTVAVEALIRWEHPKLGFVSPADFIPLAEETGLIVEIGDWVLQEACRNLRIWREQGNPDIKVAVNVSPKQLLSESFIVSVKNALNVAELPASALDIEITENIMVEEDSISVSILKELSNMGIHLLLDDFGTGHSSLSYLHKLPFDVLKIDQSFVMKMDTPEADTNIIPSIVAMSHTLNLAVVAEGVETQESLIALKQLNCEYAQGYFISRPLPAEQIDFSKSYEVA